MNVVLLGGSGFIGSSLAEILVAKGQQVTVFDRGERHRGNVAAIARQLRLVGGDFANPDDLQRAIHGADVVIHLVGSTLPGNSLHNPSHDAQANIVASIRLFELCVQEGVRRVVFVSSGGTVYGVTDEASLRESHPQQPITPYGASKLAIEKYLGVFAHQSSLDAVVLRLANPYGPRQDPLSGQGVIASWMHRLLRGEAIEVFGDGGAVRDYLHVEDAARALSLAALDERQGQPFRTFNVGSGSGHSLLDLLATLERVSGAAVPVAWRNSRRMDVPRNVLDVAAIQGALGWRASVPLEEGMASMWRQLSAR